MSGLTSVGIVILVVLIQAFLQLKPGVFALFRHYLNAKYSSEKKLRDLSGFFFMGVETATALLVIIMFFAAYALSQNGIFNSNVFRWIEAIFLIILGVAAFFCYFRRKKGTELFIPRKMETSLEILTKKAKARSDAFALGAASTIGEFIWSLPVCFVFLAEILNFDEIFLPPVLAILYILVNIVPLFIIRVKFAIGQNLADVQRVRVKNREFYRLAISASYLILATIIIVFRILV